MALRPSVGDDWLCKAIDVAETSYDSKAIDSINQVLSLGSDDEDTFTKITFSRPYWETILNGFHYYNVIEK